MPPSNPYKQTIHIFLTCLAVLSPGLVMLGLLHWHWDVSLLDIQVNYPNDEISYYMQIQGFMQAGFHTGYFTLNETPAQLGLSHFGPHGFIYPASYGLLARLIGGWEPYYNPLLHLALFSAALILYIRAGRFSGIQKLLLLGLACTFYPALLYLLSNMQEGLHLTLATLYATGFYEMLHHRLNRWQLLLFFGLIIWASLIRFTWGLLFIPYYMLLFKHYHVRYYRTIGFVMGLISVGTALLFYRYTAAPYPYSNITDLFSALSHSFSQAVQVLSANLRENFRVITQGHALEQLLGYQIFFLLVIGLIVGLRKSFSAHLSLILFNLGTIFGFAMLVYNPILTEGYRSIAAHLWMSLLLLLAYHYHRTLLVLTIVSVFFFPAFLTKQAMFIEQNYHKTAIISTARPLFDQYVQFDPQTSNPWCNTFATGLRGFEMELALLEPGIGITGLVGQQLNYVPETFRLQSKYVYLSDAEWLIAYDQGSYIPLGITPNGVLFYNARSACPPPDAQTIDPTLDLWLAPLPDLSQKQFWIPGATPATLISLGHAIEASRAPGYTDRFTLLGLSDIIKHPGIILDTTLSNDILATLTTGLMPGDLKAAHLDYLVLIPESYNQLTDVQQALILNNPAMYRQVKIIPLFYIGLGDIRLYEPVGDHTLAQFGLSTAAYTAFWQHTPPFAVDSSTVILDVTDAILAQREDLPPVYGVYESSRTDKDAFFNELMVLQLRQHWSQWITLSPEHEAAWANWQQTWRPEALPQVDYVLVTTTWLETLPPNARNILLDRRYYEPVDFAMQVYNDTYQLYRVIAPNR